MTQETQAKRLYSQAPEKSENQIVTPSESAAQRGAQVKPSKGKAKPKRLDFTTVPHFTQLPGCNPKNRPDWRIALTTSGLKDARFPGYQSRFGDGHASRRQCASVARSTGKRCRCDACQGATTCRLHGGVTNAARVAGVTVTVATLRRARVALARLGAGQAPDGFPVDIALPVSPIARGRLYEAWQNRALAPSTWRLALTETRNHEAKRRET
jgi:hypothetical protein